MAHTCAGRAFADTLHQCLTQVYKKDHCHISKSPLYDQLSNLNTREINLVEILQIEPYKITVRMYLQEFNLFCVTSFWE